MKIFNNLIISIIIVVLLATLTGCSSSKKSQLQSSQVVEAFKNAGLECENTHTMTKDDYGAAPMAAKEGTRFYIPSIGQDNGGRILSFENQEDLENTKKYYDSLAKASAMFFSWVYVKDNILIQINGDLPEDKAKQYESVLNALK